MTTDTLPVGRRKRSSGNAGWLKTLLASPKARLGFAIVMFFVLTSIFAPLIAPGDPSAFVGVPNGAPTIAMSSTVSSMKRSSVTSASPSMASRGSYQPP